MQQNIQLVLNKLKSPQPIGDYVSHVETEEGDYIVTSTNGVIRLYHGEVHNPGLLPDFRLPDIAARFRPLR